MRTRYPANHYFTPLVACTLGVISGILIERFHFPIYITILASLIFIGVCVGFRKHAPMGQVIILLVGIIVGLFTARHAESHYEKNQLFQTEIGGCNAAIYGRVISVKKLTKDDVSFVVAASTIGVNRHRAGLQDTRIAVHVYDEFPVAIGDCIHANGYLYLPGGALNPGSFDYRGWLRDQGIHAVMSIWNQGDCLRVTDRELDSRYRYHMSDRVRNWFVSSLDGLVGGDAAALLSAIGVGQQQKLSNEIRGNFSRAGVSHLLAVSGLHVGLVFGFVIAITYVLGMSRSVSITIAMLTMCAYTFLVGWRPSCVRAMVMLGAGTLSVTLGRGRHYYHCLAMAALAILLVDPAALFSVSFQLSFLSVFSLLHFLPVLDKCLRFLPKWLRVPLSVTLAAQIGVNPIIAKYFHQVSVIALPANLVIVPTAGALVASAIALPVLGAVSYPLANWFGILLRHVIAVLLKVVEWFASIPGGVLYLPSPSPALLTFYYLVIVLIPVAYRNRKLVRPTIAICIIGASILLTQPVLETLRSPEITILATRNGDAAVIKAPRGRNILVASFGGYREQDVLNYTIAPYLWSQGITRLDAIIVTRFGAEGWPDLAEFCNKFRVLEVHLPDYEETNKERAEMQSLSVIFHEKPWLLCYGGMKLQCACGLIKENYQSEVATTVEYQGKRILLAGALSQESEMLLTTQNWPSEVDVLVIPRHGKTALCYETIFHTHPEYAIADGIIENNLLRKQLKGIQILETEKTGAVTIGFSSGNITVTTFRDTNQ